MVLVSYLGLIATLPEQEDYRESLLRFLRLSTTTATATTAASMETRIRVVIANKAVPPKNPAHVFPEYHAAIDEEETGMPNLAG